MLTKPLDVPINLRDMLIKPNIREINPSDEPVHLSDVRADRPDMQTSPRDMLVFSWVVPMTPRLNGRPLPAAPCHGGHVGSPGELHRSIVEQ